MKKRRMLSRQLFIAQIIVVEAICLLTALVFYAYNAETLKNAEKARLATICTNTTIQLDAMIHSMDELSVSISTADGFVPSMRKMASPSEDDDFTDHLREIMGRAYRTKVEVYRIIALTANGNSVSVGRNELSKSETAALVADGYWHQTDRRGSSKVLVGPFLDPWVKEGPEEVFSLIRAVRDGDDLLGYIEVQMLTRRITQIYQAQWRNGDLYFAIMSSEGHIFLSNFDPEEFPRYPKIIAENAAWYPTDSIETSDEIVSISSSNYTDWKTAVIMPKTVMYKPLEGAFQIAIGFSLVMGFGIAMFIKFIVERITKPIEKVVKQVEQINLQSLDVPFESMAGSYEVEVLSDAFSTMKTRLAQAFKQEKAMKQMQTMALLESLQSRIGPHFLYNTLGSIANQCEMGNAAEAADACYHLSDLLRYSSDTATELVTIRQELDHLHSYLALMKDRYQHRLNYSVHVTGHCMDVKILRLTIQPLVENAIKYSLAEREPVRIEIKIASNDHETCIEVSDNGLGFDKATRESIHQTIRHFLENPGSFADDAQVSPRGMGLLGTLMRLYLFLGVEHFHYSIANHEDTGAVISLHISHT